jgi:Putative addiction module component
MARAIGEIEDEVRGLSSRDKERLLAVLLEELEGPPDADAEMAWLEEIQRRSRELDDGSVKAIPAAQVFARLHERLKAHGG